MANEWRTVGTHTAFDGTGATIICDCGPANMLTGPQYAVVNGVEYRSPCRINA